MNDNPLTHVGKSDPKNFAFLDKIFDINSIEGVTFIFAIIILMIVIMVFGLKLLLPSKKEYEQDKESFKTSGQNLPPGYD